MVRIKLKGLNRSTPKGSDGPVYWYAWRGAGAPLLRGEPGSPEFMASYNEAIESRRLPDPGKFRALVTLYKASGDYEKLAPSTKTHWGPWLDRIDQHFGSLSIAQFDRPEKIRPIIFRWRNRWADKPRTADLGMQVLSRVLSYAVDPLGKLAGNPCIGI